MPGAGALGRSSFAEEQHGAGSEDSRDELGGRLPAMVGGEDSAPQIAARFSWRSAITK